MKQLARIFLGTVLCVCLMGGSAFADQFGFYNITNNKAADAEIGEAQLFMDVTENNGNILFSFTNVGTAASSITAVYFDDDIPLLSFVNFQYDSIGGVKFTLDAKPKNVPGGKDPLYSFSSNYSYDSASPTQPNGVNPGESLGILFELNNTTYSGVLAALANETFRVGIHVQGFDGGGSESFINAKNEPVPEPATVLLLGVGIVGLVAYRRKKKA